MDLVDSVIFWVGSLAENHFLVHDTRLMHFVQAVSYGIVWVSICDSGKYGQKDRTVTGNVMILTGTATWSCVLIDNDNIWSRYSVLAGRELLSSRRVSTARKCRQKRKIRNLTILSNLSESLDDCNCSTQRG